MCGLNDGLSAHEVAKKIANMRHLPQKDSDTRKIKASEKRSELKKRLD